MAKKGEKVAPAPPPEPPVPPPLPEAAPRKKRRWLRGILWGLLSIPLLLIAVYFGLDTSVGHRFIVDRIERIESSTGLKIRIGRIEGSIYSKARLKDVRVFDAKGLLFSSPDMLVDWNPFAYFGNHVDVTELSAETATLHKRSEFTPSGKEGPILPDLDITVGKLEFKNLIVDKAVTGERRVGRVLGSADIRGGRVIADADAMIAGTGDRLKLRMDGQPDGDRFQVAGVLTMPKGGVFGTLAGFKQTTAIAVNGKGLWSNWRGNLGMNQSGRTVADLTVGVENDIYKVKGTIDPTARLEGKIAEFLGRSVAVDGEGRFRDNILTGRLILDGAGIDATAQGGIDFGKSEFSTMSIDAAIVRPELLIGALRARDMRLALDLSGPLRSPQFKYRLTTPQMLVNTTGFTNVRAEGDGFWAGWPITLNLNASASQITGVGTVAGGILRNVRVSGPLKITDRSITGERLQLRSDKLTSTLAVIVDLTTGRYDVLFNGTLRGFLIAGLGIVDIETRLKIIPGSGGRGTDVGGDAIVRFRRLDNAFFRSLTGGLPVIRTKLRYAPDGTLYLTGTSLNSPLLNLRGNGVRRANGTVQFKGSGSQKQYGPLQVALEGAIDRPKVALMFERPFDAAQLANVNLNLDPTGAGYAYTAGGGSILGPFTSNGAILLPRGGNTAIQVDRLQAGETVATGRINIVPAGFDGRLDIAGGGLTGSIGLNPQGRVQQITIDLTAENVSFPQGKVRIGQGRIDAVVGLDPNGTSFNGDFQATAARWGNITIAELAGRADMAGGTGQITLSAAGQRGRAFDLQTQIGVTPGRYDVALSGTIDQQSVKLAQPVTVEPVAGGYRLSNLDLSYAGGTIKGGGTFGSEGLAADLAMERLPLQILAIAYPNIGLAGTASGTLRYTDGRGGEQGDVNMTVRGLSRSALGLQSTPIDVGVAGRIGGGSAGLRAVVAAEGQTVGRVQALLSPMASGSGSSLIDRLRAAPMQAEVRYNGSADTLWRLTGVELFDLSGPVAVGANVGGTLGRPQIAGSLRTTGARLESPLIGVVLTDMNATGQFNGSRLVLDQITAKAGDGTLTGNGDFELSSDRGLGFTMNIQADNARLLARDDIGASVTGPITITSDGSGGEIKGDLVANRSSYRLGAATAGQPVPVLEVKEINRRYAVLEEDEAAARMEPWTLDMDVVAPNQMFVRGLGLDSEWSADLELGGSINSPDIRGTANLVRGNYEFAGRSFDLVRGEIVFDGEGAGVNPRLDIVASAQVDDIDAEIRVSGRGLSPQISFSSNPALPQDELLSRLLFGGAITDLSPIEAVQLGAAVASLQGGGGADLNPINALRDVIGLDRLRILPADITQERGTSIAAGKYIRRDTYVEIITDGQGYSATRIEYQVTKWLSILATISTIGRQSVNVRISKDY